MTAKDHRTRWTQRRLDGLFQEYNRLYFAGRLKHWGVVIAKLERGAVGFCEPQWKQLHIDVCRIQLVTDSSASADREISSTLLHEMAHAAARRMGHGYEFWEQMENLLRQSAPVTVGFPEAPNSKNLADVIPKRFPLSRRVMNEIEARRAEEVEKYATKKRLETQTISDEQIIADFVGAAFDMPTASEKEVVSAVAERYGLFDVGGKPKNAWAANVVSQGRKAYRDCKREDLLLGVSDS